MTIDVRGWDFGAYGGPGYGPADVSAATQLGASAYQLGQLGQEANLRGLNIAQPLRGIWQQQLATSPWNYGAAGNYGYGMEDVARHPDDLERITQYASWAQSNNLRIGPGVREHVAEMQMRANERRQNEMMSAMAAAYKPPEPIKTKLGTPSDIGKPGTFSPKRPESGGRRRDLKSLRRKKATSGYVNPIGGVASGGSGLGINTAGLG